MIRYQSSLLCSLVILASSGVAHADIPDVIYKDAKDVISDLITNEVATTTVEEIACRAGHVEVDPSVKSDADVIEIDDGKAQHFYQLSALEHYPRTLQAVYSHQFGGLKTTLVDESADLAAYLVFQALRELGESGQLFQQVSSCTRGVQCRRLSLALAESQKLAGQPDAQAKTGADKDAIKFGPFPGADQGKCTAAVEAKLENGLTLGSSPLDQDCAKPSDDTTRIDCEVAFALRAALHSDADSAEDHLRTAAALVIAAILFDALENEPTLKGKVAIDAPYLAQQMTTLLTKFPTEAPTAETVLTTLEKAITVKDSALTAKVKQVIDGLETALHRLQSQWALVTGAGKRHIDLMATIGALWEAQGALGQLCGKNSSIVMCQHLLRIEGVLGRGKPWWGVLRAASSGNIREVAHMAVTALFTSKRDNNECAQNRQCHKDLYERFAESLAYYVIDIAEDKTPSDATREAFRSAAEEVIQHIWPGGYDRPGCTVCHPCWHVLYPDFALRASWSPSYVSTSGKTLRYVASINFLTARFAPYYTKQVYVGVHVSVFDLLGPMAEIALRPNTFVYDDSMHNDPAARVFANFIEPRVDVVVGLPALSKHLVVGLGASVRPSVPYATTSSTMTPTYEYRTLFVDDNAKLSRSLEFGFSVKYIP